MTRRALGTRLLAEAVGTALLVGIGTGAVVAGASVGGTPIALLALAWFAAVALPIAALGDVSGAHLNPAVTLGLVASRRFPPREAAPYAAAQLAGAFAASLTVLATLGNSADLGATIPYRGRDGAALGLELAFTFALVGSVLWLTDPERRPHRAERLLPAAVVGVATYLIGPWTGCSLNPARTLAPALLSGAVGPLWVYLVSAPAAALLASAVVRPGAVPSRAA